MNERQIIRALLKRNGKTQPELSEMLGYKKETVGTILKGKSEMGVGKFYRMLSALGYEVVIRKADGTDKAEFMLADNDEPIETERYVSPEEQSEISRIKSENAAAMRESMKK